jgi:hypothetical protein
MDFGTSTISRFMEISLIPFKKKRLPNTSAGESLVPGGHRRGCGDASFYPNRCLLTILISETTPAPYRYHRGQSGSPDTSFDDQSLLKHQKEDGPQVSLETIL